MLGIAVLFFVGLWILFAALVTRFGWNQGKKRRKVRAWLGAAGFFMPVMGIPIIWWTIEYAMNVEYAKEFCAQTGIEIYVTPEEWKEMVGGEEAWKQMPYEYNGRPRASDSVPEVLFFKEKI